MNRNKGSHADTCRNGHPRTVENTYVVPITDQIACRICSRERSARYNRERRYRAPLLTTLDRFWRKVVRDPDTGCLAYRFAFATLVGALPEGTQLHHTCENPGCVNPDHLKPMTGAEHVRYHRPRLGTGKKANLEEKPCRIR